MLQKTVLARGTFLKFLKIDASEYQRRAASELCVRRLRLDSTTARYHFNLAFVILVGFGACFMFMRNFTPTRGGMPIGSLLLNLWTWTALAAICGGLFQFVVSVLGEEKEQGTLGLLKLTGIGPEGLIRSIFSYALIQHLILFFLQLPVLFLIISLGSVTYLQLISITLILAFVSFPLAAVGFYISVVCENRGTAIIFQLTLLALFALHLTALRGLALVVRSGSIPLLQWEPLALAFDMAADFLIFLTPFPHLLGSLTLGNSTLPSGLYLLSCLLIGVAILRHSIRSFELNSSQLDPQAFEIKRLEDIVQMQKPIASPRDPQRPSARCWENPYVWREFHFQNGGWKKVLESAVTAPIAFICISGLLFWLASQIRMEQPEFGPFLFGFSIFWLGCSIIGSAIAAIFLFSSVLTAEIKGKTLGTLFLVGRPSLEIVRELIRGRLLLLTHAVSPLLVGICGLVTGFLLPQTAWSTTTEADIHFGALGAVTVGVPILIGYFGVLLGLSSIRCELIRSDLIRGLIYGVIAAGFGVGFVCLAYLVAEVSRAFNDGNTRYASAIIAGIVLFFSAAIILTPILWQSIGRAIQHRMGQD